MPKQITISVDARAVLRALRDIREKDVPFVTAYALTKTGQDIKAAEYASMQRVFDRPTRWTLNSLQLIPATKQRLSAEIGYRSFGGTPPDRYLGPQVEGGNRSHKSHEKALIAAGIMRGNEFAVPGQGAVLDAFGNMGTGQITRILSQLQASRDPMQNMTQRSRKRALRRAGGRYFLMRGRSVSDGIYLRSSERTIVPVLVFVRAPRYAPRYPFYGTGQQVFDERFAAHLRAGFQRAIAPRTKAA